MDHNDDVGGFGRLVQSGWARSDSVGAAQATLTLPTGNFIAPHSVVTWSGGQSPGCTK